jgi:hypothetical protein
MLTAVLCAWALGAAAAEAQAPAPDEQDFDDLVAREHMLVRDGGALKRASFVCVLPDEVVWGIPGDGEKNIYVSRMNKRAPSKPSRELYVSASEGDCGMGHCWQHWMEPKSKKTLTVGDSHITNVGAGHWTTTYRLNEEVGDPTDSSTGWAECESAEFLNLLCVTERRTILITRDLTGKAFYRSENFDPHGGAGVELSAPGPGLREFSDKQHFDFKKGEFSYAVDISTPSGAQITVSKSGRKIQSEDCRVFQWSHPAKLEGQ